MSKCILNKIIVSSKKIPYQLVKIWSASNQMPNLLTINKNSIIVDI